MFSKRIPVGEKLVRVTGRPRRLAKRSRSSTLSLARGRATLFPLARVPAYILRRRWCPLDGAVLAGTAAPSAHQGLCRWPHRFRQDWRPRLWEPQARPARKAPGRHLVLISYARAATLLLSPALARLP